MTSSIIPLGCLAGGEAPVLAPLPVDEASRLAEALAVLSPWSAYPISAEALARYLAAMEADAPRFVLRLGNETAGVVGIRRRWLRGPYLQMLAVFPRLQGKGLGRAVLDWLDGEAFTAGERNVWVCASDFNAAALLFYERHGFVRVASLDGLVGDAVAEILLRKRLDPNAPD